MTKTFTKRLGILRKKEGISHDEFVNHWMNKHAALCVLLPGLRRYSVNLVDRKRFPKFNYDGFSELWFDCGRPGSPNSAAGRAGGRTAQRACSSSG